jgi:hypothetical protein
MTYKEFQEYVRTKCVYIAIYNDSEGREILVIPMLDAFAMVNDAPKREWVGLTVHDQNNCLVSADPCECLADPESHQLMDDVEAKLKEKNA